MKAIKPTFLGHSRPLLCCMINAHTPDAAINTVRAASFEGCDAFGYQYCKLEHEYRNEENVRRIFRYMEDKPIYVTNYRTSLNKGRLSDADIGEDLVRLTQWGATLCDVMGDLYAPHPLELTEDQAAIDAQRSLIDRIHAAGGEVLMSSHVLRYIPAEEVLRIALEQQRRGADIAKIVTAANSEEQELENLRITHLLSKELDIPFLFLSGGTHYKLHRTVGPMLGSLMFLCVQEYDVLATNAQPLLRATRQILTNFDYKPNIRR